MRIAEAQLVRAIHELSEEKEFTTVQLAVAMKNFLRRKRLAKRSGKIVRALEVYAEDQANLVTIEVTTAHTLSSEAKKAVETKAAELFGKGEKKTRLTFQDEPKLLGGVKLETKNTRYDFSLHRALTELRKSFSK